ncbi:MAG: hypothetical protein NDI81_05865 [Desulfobacula sp.]|nr:hypothetical protein [Desulfobacula sp.]
MAEKNDEYTYRVIWSEDDNEYVGLCAEFPSLSWLADTPEKALKGIRKLVAGVLSDMAAHNVLVPGQAQISVVSLYFPCYRTLTWEQGKFNSGFSVFGKVNSE